MVNENQALALLQAAIALGGLVLVYSGYLSAKATSKEGNRTGDALKVIAGFGLAPVLSALFCAWMALLAISPGSVFHNWAAANLIPFFQMVVALTALYAIIAAFLSS